VARRSWQTGSATAYGKGAQEQAQRRLGGADQRQDRFGRPRGVVRCPVRTGPQAAPGSLSATALSRLS